MTHDWSRGMPNSGPTWRNGDYPAASEEATCGAARATKRRVVKFRCCSAGTPGWTRGTA